MTNDELGGNKEMIKVSILACLCAFLFTASSCYAATPRDAYQLGVDCMASDHQVQAIDFFSKALAKNPRHIQALLRRSQAYALTNNFARAISDCDVVLRMDPKNSEAYFQRGLYKGFSGASGAQLFALTAAQSDLQKAAQITTDRQRQAEASAILSYDQTETTEQQRKVAGSTTTYYAAVPVIATAREHLITPADAGIRATATPAKGSRKLPW